MPEREGAERAALFSCRGGPNPSHGLRVRIAAAAGWLGGSSSSSSSSSRRAWPGGPTGLGGGPLNSKLIDRTPARSQQQTRSPPFHPFYSPRHTHTHHATTVPASFKAPARSVNVKVMGGVQQQDGSLRVKNVPKKVRAL